MQITKRLIKFNYSNRAKTKIKYIVIHDTGNPRKGAGANNHYIYFNGGNRNASAHYFVDDKEVVQLVEDFYASWHCGDGKGMYGITNSNSIGIEICINEDSNWEIALEKTIELIRYLMDKHNIPKDNVVRHFDTSMKFCPKSMIDFGWRKWTKFWCEI